MKARICYAVKCNDDSTAAYYIPRLHGTKELK